MAHGSLSETVVKAKGSNKRHSVSLVIFIGVGARRANKGGK